MAHPAKHKGQAQGQHEVDEAGWVPLPEADERLSYRRDRDVIRALASTIT